MDRFQAVERLVHLVTSLSLRPEDADYIETACVRVALGQAFDLGREAGRDDLRRFLPAGRTLVDLGIEELDGDGPLPLDGNPAASECQVSECTSRATHGDQCEWHAGTGE